MKVHLNLETVTPVFMSGADQKISEIRSSSIKGLLRWWFRVLVGNYFGDNIAGLKEAENYIFGNSDQKSKIKIIVEMNGKPKQLIYDVGFKIKQNKIKLTPHFDNESYLRDISYLFFAVKMKAEEFFKENLVKKYNRDKTKIINALKHENIFFYPPKSKFTLKIQSNDISAFKLALASLWHLIALGGIGCRWRRGAGSIYGKMYFKDIHLEELSEFIKLFFNDNGAPRDFIELSKKKNDLKRIFNEVKQVIKSLPIDNNYSGSTDPTSMSYPCLMNSTILYRKVNGTSLDCLKLIQTAYAGTLDRKTWMWNNGFRFSFADRSFSHNFIEKITNGTTNKERRPYFGLPLTYSNYNVQMIVERTDNKIVQYTRRASSIFMTAKRTNNNEYYAIIGIFKTVFLPNHKGEFKIRHTKQANKTANIKVLDNDNKSFDNKHYISWLSKDLVTAIKSKGFSILFNDREVFE